MEETAIRNQTVLQTSALAAAQAGRTHPVQDPAARVPVTRIPTTRVQRIRAQAARALTARTQPAQDLTARVLLQE